MEQQSQLLGLGKWCYCCDTASTHISKYKCTIWCLAWTRSRQPTTSHRVLGTQIKISYAWAGTHMNIGRLLHICVLRYEREAPHPCYAKKLASFFIVNARPCTRLGLDPVGPTRPTHAAQNFFNGIDEPPARGPLGLAASFLLREWHVGAQLIRNGQSGDAPVVRAQVGDQQPGHIGLYNMSGVLRADTNCMTNAKATMDS